MPSPRRSTPSAPRSRRSGRPTSSSTTRPATASRPRCSGPCSWPTGAAKRTHDGFAERHALVARTFAPAPRGHPSQGVKGFLEGATEAAGQADTLLGTLQDSMKPVEVGDRELRDGLAEVRDLLSDFPARTRKFVSLLGR